MAERALGTNGDLDKNIEPQIDNKDGDDTTAFAMKPVSFFVNTGAIPEEEQHQGDTLNGEIVPNSSSDADNASVGHSETSKASNAQAMSKSREDKIRQAREAYERERKRKINEILEAQRQAEDFRLRQQEDRRKKIEEMRRKDQERRKTVEERRRRMVELEEERRASLLRRSQARESRIDTMRSSRMPARMAMSCTFGTGEAALAAFNRPRVAFGSGTPREILAHLTPGRGARSASRGASSDPRRAAPSSAPGQTRSASVTPSSSFMAEKPGQVEKALNRRGARSQDRKPTAKPTPPPDGSNEATPGVKLRTRSHAGARPRPTSQVVTPAELDSVFARLAQPKRNLAAAIHASDSPRGASKDRRAATPAATPAAGSSKKRKKRKPKSPAAAAPKTPARRAPSPPRPPAHTAPETKEVPTSAASVDSGLSPSPQPIEKEGLDGLGILGPEVVSQEAEPVSEISQVSQEPASDAAAPPGSHAAEETESDTDSEPVAFEPLPSIMTQSMPAVMLSANANSTKDLTEDEYRVRIAEQRRLVREKMERERQQKEEERQARAEQERLRREQARQMAEEAQRRMAEEEERQQQEEAAARAAEQERLRREEEERRQREEEEQRAREAAEQERLERMAREEEERQARRARLERIMSRVKKPEEAPPASADKEEKEEEPEEPEPASAEASPPRKSASPADAPKFKSALLQSMLAGGRLSAANSDGAAGLRRASGSALSLLQAGAGAPEGGEAAAVAGKGLGAGEAAGMPHSFSMDALSAATRRHADAPSRPAASLPNGDAGDDDEEVDGPALLSANIRTRLDEAKAAASRLDPRLENDNSRTAFDEILNLPAATGAADRHLVAPPVEPIPGVWFEQPSAPAQTREQTVISDLLS